ncbi:hypothetical protein KEN49_CDS0108 [Pseudomonas phage vB_Pae3705-KEN49]
MPSHCGRAYILFFLYLKHFKQYITNVIKLSKLQIGKSIMLDYALEKCREIPYVKHRQRVYSVITDKRGRIISESQNMYGKTHPVQKRYSLKAGLSDLRCEMHSELRSIILSKGKGYRIYVARVGADGRPLDAYPCPTCQMAINDHGKLKEVIVSIGK